MSFRARSAAPSTPCFRLNSAMLNGGDCVELCPKATCTSRNTYSWPREARRPSNLIFVLVSTCSGTSSAVTSMSAASCKASPVRSKESPTARNLPSWLSSTASAMRRATCRTDASFRARRVIHLWKTFLSTDSAYSALASTPRLSSSDRCLSAAARASRTSGSPESSESSTRSFRASSACNSTPATTRKYSSHSWRNGFRTATWSDRRNLS
mmetsp:Transcript_5000/g.13954  ORF Transcript_5000/g.13954 Transcript_5000/m.13954 type:complete len:211 (-) Transcript_5000:310-942(-)